MMRERADVSRDEFGRLSIRARVREPANPMEMSDF